MAMPKKSDTQLFKYNLNNQSIIDPDMRSHIQNHHIVLLQHADKKNFLGNYTVTQKFIRKSKRQKRQESLVPLHLHHVMFKALRTTLPSIPYTSFQTPKQHHQEYHNDSTSLYIKYNHFVDMKDYLNRLKASIVRVSQNFNDDYSALCSYGGCIAVDAQGYFIGKAYSWLYLRNSSRYLLLAQRLISKDAFPNNTIANKSICESQKPYIVKELSLSRFLANQLASINRAQHILGALRARIQQLNIYTNEYNLLTENEAMSIANRRYGDAERFYNSLKRLGLPDIDDTVSEASSLNG